MLCCAVLCCVVLCCVVCCVVLYCVVSGVESCCAVSCCRAVFYFVVLCCVLQQSLLCMCFQNRIEPRTTRVAHKTMEWTKAKNKSHAITLCRLDYAPAKPCGS